MNDDEREELIRAWEQFHRVARGRPAFGVVVANEDELPNAKWRQRIATLQASYPGPLHVGIVTHNTLARGVMTALGWLTPRESNYHVYPFDTFDAAIVKLEAIAGAPLDKLRTLHAEVLEKAGDPANLPARGAGVLSKLLASDDVAVKRAGARSSR
jgi:hypothetical protein